MSKFGISMPNDLLLDNIEGAAEKPFIAGYDRDFVHTPLSELGKDWIDPYDDLTRRRVAMLGVFAVGHNLWPRIVVAADRFFEDIPLIAAEAGFLVARNAFDQHDGYTLEVPRKYIDKAMDINPHDEECQLVCGVQIYCDEQQEDVEATLVTNKKLYGVAATVRELLMRQRTHENISQNKTARNIFRLSVSAREKFAFSAAATLLKDALDTYGHSTDEFYAESFS